jgi:hypothetical protein
MKTIPVTVGVGDSKTLAVDLETKADTAQTYSATDISSAKFRVYEVGQDTRVTIVTGSTASAIVDSARTETVDFWNGMSLEFQTGACAGEVRRISDFTPTGTTLTLDVTQNALPATPAVGDLAIIRGYPLIYEQDLDAHASGVVSGNTAQFQITAANGCTASPRTVEVVIIASYSNGGNADTESVKFRVVVE